MHSQTKQFSSFFSKSHEYCDVAHGGSYKIHKTSEYQFRIHSYSRKKNIQSEVSHIIITSLVIVRSSTSITHIVEEGVKDFTDYN
jgi:hypothetical protein